ncbi:hypothetical protein Acr_00g0045040 [Actinidia rufa]|uniref:Uncharacterized protein n=1 Tax=Actinidia rufa TaxID=165716 RepID=A0A7J0DJ17_9ERIC|nr:hypothetical protein Acr_00g0045040 [Actinidia rufa]
MINCRHLRLGVGTVRSVVIVPRSLNSSISDVMKALARGAFVFGSVHTELQCRTPPSLLYSDSSAEFSALARPNYIIIAMEKFRATHGIPTNVIVEHPGPNDVPRVVVDNLNRILVSVKFVRTMLTVDTLMQILDKPFSAEDLLHVYTVLLGNSELGMKAFGHSREFNDNFKHYSEECKEAIQVTNNRQESRDVDALFLYKPHYPHKISHRTAKFVKASIPPLCIEGRAPQRDAFSPERPEAKLSTHLPSIQIPQYAIDPIVELTEAIMLVEPSSLEAPLLDKRKRTKLSGVRPRGPREEQDRRARAGHHVAKRCRHPLRRHFGDHEKFVGDAARSSEHHDFSNLDISAELKRAKSKTSNLDFKLKKARLTLADVNQLKVDLASVEQARNSSYTAATQAQNKVDATEAALAQLQAVACGSVYERVFSRGVSRVGDNYSSFDEENLNRLNEDEDVPKPVLVHDATPTNEVANPMEETGETIAEVFGERSVEEIGRDDGEDASQYLPPEL